MFRSKKPAPAVLMSMSDENIRKYNKEKTKEALITITIMVTGVVASVALADAITKIADKKLQAHYTAQITPSIEN